MSSTSNGTAAVVTEVKASRPKLSLSSSSSLATKNIQPETGKTEVELLLEPPSERERATLIGIIQDDTKIRLLVEDVGKKHISSFIAGEISYRLLSSDDGKKDFVRCYKFVKVIIQKKPLAEDSYRTAYARIFKRVKEYTTLPSSIKSYKAAFLVRVENFNLWFAEHEKETNKTKQDLYKHHVIFGWLHRFNELKWRFKDDSESFYNLCVGLFPDSRDLKTTIYKAGTEFFHLCDDEKNSYDFAVSAAGKAASLKSTLESKQTLSGSNLDAEAEEGEGEGAVEGKGKGDDDDDDDLNSEDGEEDGGYDGGKASKKDDKETKKKKRQREKTQASKEAYEKTIGVSLFRVRNAESGVSSDVAVG